MDGSTTTTAMADAPGPSLVAPTVVCMHACTFALFGRPVRLGTPRMHACMHACTQSTRLTILNYMPQRR